MGRAGRASERAPSFPARIGMRPTPALCQPPPSRAGPARWHRAPLTCSSLPQSRAAQAVRTRDVSAATPAEPRLPARIGQAPNGALSSAANDAHTGRSRPRNRKGAPSPPRSNGQAFDEARNPVTVAGRRRYKASVPAHPCWDQAFPCCSPLTGWAPGPVAASRPSGAAALSYLTEGGKAPLGSTHWQNYFPAPSGSGSDDETPPWRVRWRAHDGASGASPRLYRRLKAAGYGPPLSMSSSLLQASGRVRH
jgi:hypothetical protein